jgi:UDP-N-acetylglucosamine 1-carboxyvinyltransferase
VSDADVLKLTGGVPLGGTVRVRGSKNSVPKLMVAALLTEEPVVIYNVPRIVDTKLVADLLQALGGSTHEPEDGQLRIEAGDVHAAGATDLEYFHSRSRIPVLTCAPLLHRTGRAMIWKPGGCSIGERPVDQHLNVLRAFGATSERTATGYTLTAEVGGLRGAVIELAYPSVGATEQFLLGAVVARGDSELHNAATEPEIIDLISVLQRMGALITVRPDRVIHVIGVDRLHGAEHTAIPDRLEAASWASLALATDGEITVNGVRQADLSTYLNAFRRAGGGFTFNAAGNEVTFRRDRPMPRPLVIETDVHPGFMTDWQSPMVTAMTQADGVTVLHETVYENRLGYTDALRALGAQIQVFTDCLGRTPCRFGARNHRHSAVIVGPAKLQGTTLHVPDLRAGFSYVLAALAAHGDSVISGASLLERGYENFREKLTAVGVRVN